MALPEQIRKQSEAVQELYKQLSEATEKASGESSAQDNISASDADQSASSSADAPASNNAAPLPANEQNAGSDKASDETVLQKYRTLQGMYNAEVPRLHAHNKELNQRVQQMEQLLASMSAQQAAAAVPTATTVQGEKFVTEKDVEEYGESIDMMRKVAREEVGSLGARMAQLEKMLSQIQTNVVPQVQAVVQKQAVSAEQQFWADLTTTVPNWRETNEKAEFQSWLLEVDPLTGISRQTYLEDAQRSLDARRVANFFRAWLQSTGEAPVAQTQNRASTSELEKQVAPGRSKNSGNSQTNKARTYTPADIQKFFNDVRAGRYKGREAERNRIERDIFAAQQENRIQLNA